MSDRYFDHMGAHFAHKIYSSTKGSIRLAVLTRDLQEWLPAICEHDQSLRVLDAGAGLGHMSAWLVQRGHRVTVCEPSAEMLEAARLRLDGLESSYPVEYLQCALQDVPADSQYDLIICHAVLEWLADPAAAIQHLNHLCRPSGAISLAFYNRDALIYKNLIKGQFRKLANKPLAGSRRSLTPQQPLDPRDVHGWIAETGLTCQAQSGIRVFYDYMPAEYQSLATESQIIEHELQYSRHPAYRGLGRYLHCWLRPNQAD
ncbi:MAG: SAM-dependent methyltransferase [Gammaproteobacteria bacterium HGW-Gammaproteobacteria-11]|nr:MAG: SAM-dependent methyltransferase [Gammaproteobacteria bacterium HGW-Gammaproteobacteria-11]